MQTELSDLIGDAPAGLNTLGELSDALNDDINALSNATTLINANETHIDNLVTLSGVAKDTANLGTFTGSTITDSVVVKVALQELETAVETKLASSSVSAYGATLIDDADAATARTTLGLDASTVRTILGITENNGDPADGRGMYYDTGASKYLLSS